LIGIIDEIGQGQRVGESFYLKHPDDKGDHIFVDDSFNIAGIIDWEWTQTVPSEDAFTSPCMMWLVGRFYERPNELSDEEVRFADIFCERGRDDLAQCVVHSRKVQRFSFAVGPPNRTHGTHKAFIGGLG
jgi:hypothetical protein